MIDDRFTKANLAGVTEQEQAPLAEAIALVVREKLTGRPTPEGASAVADLWRDWIDDKAAGDSAEELCDEAELERLRAFLDKQLQNLAGAVGRLANRLQRRLMAQQNRSWSFDLEEGVLDPARLTRVVTDPTSRRSPSSRSRKPISATRSSPC
jgi:cobalamin biosynthesis protein CobT